MNELVLKDVTLQYDDGKASVVALRDLDLCVSGGQSISIIGPSGCGKSSMLSMICGLIEPTSGSVTVDGKIIDSVRQKTAYIPQDFGLLPWKNALENAELGLKIRRIPKAERRRIARSSLDSVGLSGFEDAYPNDLSGGMKQRLALARSLTIDADLLLMDEPLSALDALMRESIQDMLLTLWMERKYTQIIVTHSIEEAVFLGERICVMSSRPGSIKTIVDNPFMGTREFRDTSTFYDLCNLLRSCLKDVSDGSEHGRSDPECARYGDLGTDDE